MREVAVSAVLWFFLLDEGDDGLRHPTPPPSHACGKKIWAPSLLLYSSSFHAGYNYPTEAPPPCFVHKSPWEFSRVFIREFVGRRLIVQYYCEACAQQFPFFSHRFQGRNKELFSLPARRIFVKCLAIIVFVSKMIFFVRAHDDTLFPALQWIWYCDKTTFTLLSR